VSEQATGNTSRNRADAHGSASRMALGPGTITGQSTGSYLTHLLLDKNLELFAGMDFDRRADADLIRGVPSRERAPSRARAGSSKFCGLDDARR
jgi:hypothetical protein